MPATPRPEDLRSADAPARGATSVLHGVAPTGDPLARRAAAATVRATRAELLAGRQAAVLELIAGMLDEPDLERTLDALAGLLQGRFGAARVAIGLADPDGSLALGAIAHQARVDASSAEARLLLDAMAEASGRDATLRYPAHDARLGALVAHRALAGRREDTVLLSVPMYHDARLVGVLLLERRDGDAFAPPTVELLERIALLAAPLVALRREAERGAPARLADTAGRWLARRLGTDRPGARVAAAFGALALAALCLVPVERRVVAEAELVPLERRLVTAPISGYVEEVSVTAGQRVERGQLLARLERRELELEAARHDSEIATAEAEFRQAMASHDRKAIAVARARLARERALRELAERRLERSELRAPIAGIVVNADPLDRSGAPVTRGDTLFEIAPATGYEVHLLVDERDVRDVRAGQHGALALKARPGDALELDVRAVHPVAESAEGASRFRVRASLRPTPPDTDVAARAGGADAPALGAARADAAADTLSLRPGERGVAHLDAGRTTIAARALRPIAHRLAELRWRLGL